MALDLRDFSPNGNTLTNNAVTESNVDLPFPESSSAADFFSPSSAYFDAGDTASLSITNTMTIEFWVRPESTPTSGNAMALTSKWQNATDQDYHIWLVNDSGTLKLEAEISQNGNAGYDGVRWNWSPTLFSWAHVAVTITPANAIASEFEFFLNGVSQGNGTSFINDGAISIHNGNSHFVLGSINGSDSLLDGRMDDIRVWNTIRTSTEINTLMGKRLLGSETGLAAYWPFDIGAKKSYAFFM